MSVLITQRFIQIWNAEDVSAAEHRQAPNLSYYLKVSTKVTNNP